MVLKRWLSGIVTAEPPYTPEEWAQRLEMARRASGDDLSRPASAASPIARAAVAGRAAFAATAA